MQALSNFKLIESNTDFKKAQLVVFGEIHAKKVRKRIINAIEIISSEKKNVHLCEEFEDKKNPSYGNYTKCVGWDVPKKKYLEMVERQKIKKKNA